MRYICYRLRGGSWANLPKSLRSAFRDWSTVGYQGRGNRLRLAGTLNKELNN